MRKLRMFFHKFPSPLPLLFIIFGTIVVILYGRGYRPDEGGIKPTGLLSANSDPAGAQVYIDDKLRTATNDTFNIDPGWYTVTISKEGYIAWQKKLRVQGEVATRIDPFLFPQNPSLSPLTTIGIKNPIVSPDGAKIAYTVPAIPGQPAEAAKRSGLWVYALSSQPLLGFNRDQRQIGTTTNAFNFSNVGLVWSADSTQVMVASGSSTRLYQVSGTDNFQTLSMNNKQSILNEWETDRQLLERQKLASFKQPVIDMATSSAKIIGFSPDETKIVYEATQSATLAQVITPLIGTNPTEEQRSIEAGKIYVYDAKEDKNYFILDKNELPLINPSPTPQPSKKPVASPIGNSGAAAPVHWFPTSRHLVLTTQGKIDIMEYDRTNWVTVYSGPFQEGFMAPYPNGSRIIILTNLNPGVSSYPNLYTVNLR